MEIYYFMSWKTWDIWRLPDRISGNVGAEFIKAHKPGKVQGKWGKMES
jgi:hypothetical protein